MKRYRIDGVLNAIGGFWPPGDPTDVTTGTISTLNGRLHLLVSPQFKRLTSDEIRAALSEFGTVRESRRIDALLGQTKEGACTLLYLTEISGDGLTDASTGLQIVSDQWRVSSVLIGLHIDGAESESIDAAAFYLSRIHEWLPQATQLEMNETGRTFFLPWQGLQFFRFHSPSLDAEVICEIFPSKRPTKSVPRIKISPRQPRSLQWFVSLIPRLENFFTLMLGTTASMNSVQCFRGERESGWFIRRTRNRREKINYQQWVRVSASETASALENWLAVPVDQRPVETTVLGMIRKSSLFTETEFLALAQSLEGFGRLHFERNLIPKKEFRAGLTKLKAAVVELWGGSEIATRCSDALSTANEASYGARIGQTYDLLTPEFAAALLGERASFVQRVVQTRNYFTHLGIRKQRSVVADGNELFLLNQRLHALLRCVMLLDLGIKEDALREPILYQATRWKLL